ncbi:unnamed protein product, partial [Staurois parvus]
IDSTDSWRLLRTVFSTCADPALSFYVAYHLVAVVPTCLHFLPVCYKTTNS